MIKGWYLIPGRTWQSVIVESRAELVRMTAVLAHELAEAGVFSGAPSELNCIRSRTEPPEES